MAGRSTRSLDSATVLTDFDETVIAFALKEIGPKELESWVYAHSDDILRELGPEMHLRLVELNYASELAIVEQLNPWFRGRFPNISLQLDLRQMRSGTMSPKARKQVAASLRNGAV